MTPAEIRPAPATPSPRARWARRLLWLALLCLLLPLPLLGGRFSPASTPGQWQPLAWWVFALGMGLAWLALLAWPPAAPAQPVRPARRAQTPMPTPPVPRDDPDAEPLDAGADPATDLPVEALPEPGPGSAFWHRLDAPQFQRLVAQLALPPGLVLRPGTEPSAERDLWLHQADAPDAPAVGLLRCHWAPADEIVRIDKLRPLLALQQRHGLSQLLFATTGRLAGGARDLAGRSAVQLLDLPALDERLAQCPPEQQAAWRELAKAAD